MDRRTDRTIGLVTIIAVAFFPAAVLSINKIGNPFDGGPPLETPISPLAENYPGAPKPPPDLETRAPAVNLPAPPPPQNPPPQLPKPTVPTTPVIPKNVNSFDRLTNLVTFQVTGQECLEEKAHFTIKPFTMTATVKRSKYLGKPKKLCGKPFETQQVSLKGHRRVTRVNGGPQKVETLDDVQLLEIARGADPTTLTKMMKAFGAREDRVKKTDFYTYTLNGISAIGLWPLLPQEYRDAFPATALSGLNLDASDLTYKKKYTIWFQISGFGPLGGAGLGVIYSGFK